MQLFRSMKEDVDGLPVVGATGRTLGVRPGNAPTPDVLAISAHDLVMPGQGGISVAPHDPMHLLKHRRPSSLGGTGLDPVWYIETDDLPPDLQFRQDSVTHGVIEPVCAMTLQKFEDALAASRSNWKLNCR
jgi:hypothetical protein